MPSEDIIRSITVTFRDDGRTVATARALVETVTRDEAGIVVACQHKGTRLRLSSDDIAAALPNADLLAQISVLTADAAEAAAETARLKADLASLQAEVAAVSRGQAPAAAE